jgi:Flp pilus assembly protein TadG
MDREMAMHNHGAAARSAVRRRGVAESRRRSAAPGQSLVEFALVVSVLLLVFFGVLDLGRVFHAYIIITNSAREGARYGSMHPDDLTGIVNRVLSEADNSGIVLAAGNVGITTSGAPSTPIVVTVQHDFSLVSAWLGRQTLHLQARAEMQNY